MECDKVVGICSSVQDLLTMLPALCAITHTLRCSLLHKLDNTVAAPAAMITGCLAVYMQVAMIAHRKRLVARVNIGVYAHGQQSVQC